MARQLDAGDVLLDRRMGVLLADEQGVAARGEDRFAHGLAGIQIIAEIDRLEPGVLAAVRGHPTFHE